MPVWSVSAIDVNVSAKKRAAFVRLRPLLTARSVRLRAPQRNAFSPENSASCFCASVRVVLFAPPSVLVSFHAVAYFDEVSAGGAGGKNDDDWLRLNVSGWTNTIL